MAQWLSTLYWDLKRRVPPRRRAALRNLWEGLLNGAPDYPFLLARQRYDRRLAVSDAARPSVLLRLAAFRKRIPPSVQTFELPGRPDLSMANVDSIGTRVIFWTGDNWVSQHAAGLKIWEELCRRAKHIVEVGANVGYYTIAGGAAASGEYTAYEPHPRSCAALRRNLELNAVRLVTVVEAAAVPKPVSKVELVCPTDHDRGTPSGAMVRGSPFESLDRHRTTESFVVDAVSFGAAITGSDLVKIDVEGLEAQLLSAGWEQITQTQPAVMVEVHAYNRELRALVPELMRDLNAVVYAMRRDDLMPVEPHVWEAGSLEAYHTWDYLVVPAIRASLVEGLVTRRP